MPVAASIARKMNSLIRLKVRTMDELRPAARLLAPVFAPELVVAIISTAFILGEVRLNWKLLRLAIIPACAIMGAGCGGINGSGSVSPATFLLPGLMQYHPKPAQPATPSSQPETIQLLAQSR
jgi:hypothetical protein